MPSPLRLICSTSALVGNFQSLERLAGCRTGAAVKADGYGLGVGGVVSRLFKAGCRDFFVSTWQEANALADLPPDCVSVLHGLGPDDLLLPGVRPVLVSVEQINRWRSIGADGGECDVMVDTGMNRLGISMNELEAAAELNIHTLHSHLACADEVSAMNDLQLRRFQKARSKVRARRYSLANSAGIFLGKDYAFDLVRPGLALYGGVPRAEAGDVIRTVARLEARVIQVRTVEPGETVGYNAMYRADRPTRVAILNIGYADGYRRAFSSLGTASFGGCSLPVIGRVSMDLVAIDASASPDVREGDWLELDFDLPRWSAATGISQYELLTGLGSRLERVWS